MSPRPRAGPVRMLLVEDNPADVDLTREVLRDTGVPHELDVVTDGEEALARLQSVRAGAAARPHIVFLDLNLPKVDGHAVLARLKGDPELRRIPVVVLTTSTSEDEVQRCYDMHANAYMVKPVSLGEFLAAMKAFLDFWLTHARLPPR